MKKFKNEKTEIALNLIKVNGDAEKKADYADLIETCLDIVPQGGFTPKDIRDRNRIQETIDKFRNPKSKEQKDKDPDVISFEDSDYENLSKIVKSSRWTSRDKSLQKFLFLFEKEDKHEE